MIYYRDPLRLIGQSTSLTPVPEGGSVAGSVASMSPRELLQAFCEYQTRRGLSPATQTAYRQYILQLVLWLGDRPLHDLQPADIELVYLGHWSSRFTGRYGRPPSGRTMRNHLIALNAFFGFMTRFGIVPRNPMDSIERPRIHQRRNDHLSPGESDDLLAACLTPGEQILIPFLRWTGLRGGELATLLKRDVDLEQMLITVRKSKTDAGLRTIPVLPPLVQPISSWLAYQRRLASSIPTGRSSQAVWVSRSDTPRCGRWSSGLRRARECVPVVQLTSTAATSPTSPHTPSDARLVRTSSIEASGSKSWRGCSAMRRRVPPRNAMRNWYTPPSSPKLSRDSQILDDTDRRIDPDGHILNPEAARSKTALSQD